MTELLALLLPIAAASGWWAAKRSIHKESNKLRRGEMDPAYFRGLNYLVNEQPDKAIDVFMHMLEVNSETVEMHLALGSLFRRRGETERAIRIHQNLIARQTLSVEQRSQALLELGRDYLRAGLLDRAESLFVELVENKHLVLPALENLKLIYQHEKDWQKVLKTCRQLKQLGDKSQSKDETHFLCELANLAIEQDDLKMASQYLQEACSIDRNAMRPMLMQAELFVRQNQCEEAMMLYQKLTIDHSAYIGEFVDVMADCYHAVGRGREWIDWLKDFYRKHGNLHLMLAIADEIERSKGTDSAIVFLNEELVTKPSLHGVQRLIRLRLDQQGESRTTFLETLNALIVQMTDKQAAYQCHRCGFATRTLHWQCPGCRAWGSMLPSGETV